MGIKAGTLGGFIYIGGLAVFNIVLLYAFKPEAFTLISQNFPACSGTSGNSTAISACFNSVIDWYIPYIALLGFFVSLFFSGLFGRFYESLPGRSYLAKGESIAILAGLGLLVGDLYGVLLGSAETYALAAFFIAWTAFYGVIMGRLYRRYTRLVRFESVDPKLVRVMVDGKDFTGKARTFATTSNHMVRAEVAEGASFREWSVSGGVVLEDPRSFETFMEVNGDGLLKVQGTLKY